MASRNVSLRLSSNIASASYDDQTMKLQVTFRRGATYEYSEVDGQTVKAWERAQSAGEYFAHYIRNLFPYVQVA